jgi:lipopolysaccharide transport protein LptA
MIRFAPGWAWLAFVAAFAVAATAGARDVSTMGIAVLPFERNAPPGATVPDVETLLADRIATLGVKHVAPPSDFEIAAEAEPDAGSVRQWAADSGSDAVVAGRTTRIGNQVSVDVRLRSGATGAVAGTYVAEIASPDRLDAVVDDLAQQILAGAEPLAPLPPPVSAPAASQPDGGNGSFGIAFDTDKPLAIRSDELESVRMGDSRKLIFSQNVEVTQEQVSIRSDRLEAIYPPKASQPSQMVATGRVRMSNGKNEARCDRATYERAKDLLICRGNAELREGVDCVKGEWIEFDLAADTVKVGGGATVMLGGDDSPSAGLCR